MARVRIRLARPGDAHAVAALRYRFGTETDSADRNQIAVCTQMYIVDEEAFSLQVFSVALLGPRRWQKVTRPRLRAVV